MKILKDKQDLTYLKWSHIRTSSGTAGTFLKSVSNMDGVKKYYKISDFDTERGVIGHECINEIIVDRLLTILGVDHLDYQLINGEIEIEGNKFNTFLCSSLDFKEKGESKVALDDYFYANRESGESHYDFCTRNGFKKYIDQMIAVDFIILNRDRHGANLEVLRNQRKHTLRLAPLFDHGLSLVFPCKSKEEVLQYDIFEDKPCNNFIGSKSCFENLQLIKGEGNIFENKLKPQHKDYIFEDLVGILPEEYIETIWKMIYERYKIYENIRDI